MNLLESECNAMEVYSIDEAFLDFKSGSFRREGTFKRKFLRKRESLFL